MTIRPDIAAALAEKGLSHVFESLPPSHQKEYVKWIDEAKKAETRVSRIQKMLEMLAGGQERG